MVHNTWLAGFGFVLEPRTAQCTALHLSSRQFSHSPLPFLDIHTGKRAVIGSTTEFIGIRKDRSTFPLR